MTGEEPGHGSTRRHDGGYGVRGPRGQGRDEPFVAARLGGGPLNRHAGPLDRDAGPPVFAAVDVGSNSVHLLVAAVRGHRLDPLVDESVLLGLGDTVETHGSIPEPRRDEVVSELARYAVRARELGARDVVFVGTQPLRRAADARALVAAVEGATGVALHVLDHEEEALLNLLGATGGRPIVASLAVVDIGGGSSEIVVVEPGAHARSGGLPIGCATLTRRLVAHDPPTPDEIATLRAAAQAAVADAPRGAPATMIAVGGTSSNLVKVVPVAGRDRSLTRRRLVAACRTLGGDPADVVAERFGITAQRARLLPAGAAILGALMDHYGVERVTAVEEGLREGVVLALARAGAGWRDRLDALAHGWGV